MTPACRVERWDLPWSGEAAVALDPLQAVDARAPVVVFELGARAARAGRTVVGRLDWRSRSWDLVGPEREAGAWREQGGRVALLVVDVVEPHSGRRHGGLYRVVAGTETD